MVVADPERTDEIQRLMASVNQLLTEPRLPPLHRIYRLQQVGAGAGRRFAGAGAEIPYRQLIYGREGEEQVAQGRVSSAGQIFRLRHTDGAGVFPAQHPLGFYADLLGQIGDGKVGALPGPAQHLRLQGKRFAPPGHSGASCRRIRRIDAPVAVKSSSFGGPAFGANRTDL